VTWIGLKLLNLAWFVHISTLNFATNIIFVQSLSFVNIHQFRNALWVFDIYIINMDFCIRCSLKPFHDERSIARGHDPWPKTSGIELGARLQTALNFNLTFPLITTAGRPFNKGGGLAPWKRRHRPSKAWLESVWWLRNTHSSAAAVAADLPSAMEMCAWSQTRLPPNLQSWI
jgi:hypothetical protein